MTARELREKYLAFFESKGHQVYPSASLVPYDATGRLDESLMFTGAGMVQFKPFFRGVAQPPSKCLTDVQKCLRTTDIEEVGDPTHLTFFEMLGNFSFGDYFKKDAIAYSWEFLTSPQWLGLDPKRLSFTVFEEDDEAYGFWAEHLRAAGIDPETRIFRLGEETNYWPAGAFSKGPPGPCGPNSEMFYWTPNDEDPPSTSSSGITSPLAGEVGERSEPGEEGSTMTEPPPTTPSSSRSAPRGGGYSREDYLRDEKAGKWLEIWNDVFIQYEWKGRLKNPERPSDGWVKEGMDPLPFQSVDTGMGLERTITVLNGTKSVYDNDLFEPVFRAIRSEVRGPRSGAGTERDVSGLASAERIIADHLRAACFCIADGILPSNTGRGYVLRRLIRRAVLKGQRVLGIEEPFLHNVYEGVAEALGGHYTELAERREMIVETLRNEEGLFRRTLKEGFGVFLETLTDHVIPEIAKRLHEETGTRHVLFNPLEQAVFQTQSLKPWTLQLHSMVAFPGRFAFQLYDTYGFPLEVTQELCQEAGIEVDLEGFEAAMKEAQERSKAAHSGDTVYGGVTVRIDLYALHDHLEVSDGSDPSDKSDVTDRTGKAIGPTPTLFTGYQETTTQARIVGALPFVDEEPTPGARLVIALDRTPFYAESGGQVSDTGTIEGSTFKLKVVDLIKQDGVIVHLVEVLEGQDFDLSGKTPEEAKGYLQGLLYGQPVIARVDAPRRRDIARNHTATHLLHAALRSVLGKHVTQAGSLVSPEHLRFDFTHGKAMTAEELALVERMVNDQILQADAVNIHMDVPIAEAKAKGAMALFGEKYGDKVRVVEISGSLPPPAPPSFSQSENKGVAGAIARLQEQLREEKKRVERLRAQGTDSQQAATLDVKGVELAIQKLDDGDMKEATAVADRLADAQPNRVVVVALAADGKVSLAVKVGAEAQAKGAHAGNLVRELAKRVGGGGGGRPDFATAGGKDVAALEGALRDASGLLAAQL
ncbi:MAG: alanine--tRNA ligase [Armatimonadetes bacterium]|nr:alanine--tRNA ligase [Armatimonadota bacterium]